MVEAEVDIDLSRVDPRHATVSRLPVARALD
jgi:hypothetical protein